MEYRFRKGEVGVRFESQRQRAGSIIQFELGSKEFGQL